MGMASEETDELARERRLRQVRIKARRILREFVQLAGDGAGGVGFMKLARTAVTMRKCTGALRQSELLSGLSEIQLSMMASSGRRQLLKRYTVLYREGSMGSRFYILVKGLIETSAHGGRSTRIDCDGTRPNGGYELLGVESLLGRPRAATLRLAHDCELIVFSASHLNVREDGAAAVARKVFEAFVEGELSHMTQFADVPPRTLKQLVGLLGLEEHAADETLFEVGTPGDKIYILMHGSILLRGKGSALELVTLRAEQGQAWGQAAASSMAEQHIGLPVFGEMALLDRGKLRASSARTLTDSNLLVLSVEHFAACLHLLPDMKTRLRTPKHH